MYKNITIYITFIDVSIYTYDMVVVLYVLEIYCVSGHLLENKAFYWKLCVRVEGEFILIFKGYMWSDKMVGCD